jgi:hypothetical protein
MELREVENHLFLTAENAARNENFIFTACCEFHVKHKISCVAIHVFLLMKRNPAWIENFPFAEKVVEQLVHEMALEGFNRGYKRELHPDTYFAALQRMGPVWLLVDPDTGNTPWESAACPA